MNDLLRQIKLQIADRLDRKLPILEAHIRGSFDLGERAFRRALKQHNTSFRQLYVDVKMEKAARLLLTTADSQEAISAACGYQDRSAFQIAFKHYYRITPNEWRELHGVKIKRRTRWDKT